MREDTHHGSELGASSREQEHIARSPGLEARGLLVAPDLQPVLKIQDDEKITTCAFNSIAIISFPRM